MKNARRSSRSLCTLTILIAGTALLPCFAKADDDAEIHIGINGAGQLVFHFHAVHPVELPASVFSGINGFASGVIGFHNADDHVEDPAKDFYALPFNTDIQVILVAADPGMLIHDGLHIMNIGDAMTFGQPYFDYHPIFNIFSGHPGETFSLQLVIHDRSGAHADSEPFEFIFTPEGVPCPADFNRDGGIDGADISDFFEHWEAGMHEADVNDDGGVNGSDVEVFFAAWENGGC